jgi:hypothetical protein
MKYSTRELINITIKKVTNVSIIASKEKVKFTVLFSFKTKKW